MSDVAIRVENLGKRYRLRHEAVRPSYRTLREDLLELPRRVWRQWRASRRATTEEFWALRDVSFEVKAGEVIGVIGRNGAGKSTLLKILSRIVDPTAGAADIFGRVGSLLEVGTGFHPELTGRENIFLSGALLGMRRPEVRRRFDEIVAFAELEKFVDTPCKHYSSGMYLRLGFAVAAHLDAEILLVDEVLAVGDVQFQRKCLGKMGEVSQHGRTIMLVSHDLEAVRRLAQRSVWIDRGAVARVGPTSEVIERYLESALGAMNAANGEVVLERDERSIWFSRARLVGGDGSGRIDLGDSVTLTFDVNADALSADKPVCFAIGVRTEDGFPISLVLDKDSNFRLGQGIGHTKRISVRFDQFPLYPGRYFIRLWAGSHDGLETFDDRQDCMVLHVADGGNVSQRRLLRHQGLIFFQPHWEIEP